jgi:aerobic carbon-monoxide dehydrogenase medium subunit
MAPFELEEPDSLTEALGLLDPEDPAVRPIAGGTALMLMMKSGLYRPRRLVSLRKVAPGRADIRVGPDGTLEIGAMLRLSELQRSAVIRDFAPVIAATLLTHSNVRVRNVATIGGNLAHADPHMDLPPMLIALDAPVRATGPAGEREIAVEDLFAAYLETVLANNELITSVWCRRNRSAAPPTSSAPARPHCPAIDSHPRRRGHRMRYLCGYLC